MVPKKKKDKKKKKKIHWWLAVGMQDFFRILIGFDITHVLGLVRSFILFLQFFSLQHRHRQCCSRGRTTSGSGRREKGVPETTPWPRGRREKGVSETTTWPETTAQSKPCDRRRAYVSRGLRRKKKANSTKIQTFLIRLFFTLWALINARVQFVTILLILKCFVDGLF